MKFGIEYCAVRGSHENLVELLLKSRRDINCGDAQGDTPLIAAVAGRPRSKCKQLEPFALSYSDGLLIALPSNGVAHHPESHTQLKLFTQCPLVIVTSAIRKIVFFR
jgi:hypothetical protein